MKGGARGGYSVVQGNDKTSQEKDWDRGCSQMRAMAGADRVPGPLVSREAER